MWELLAQSAENHTWARSTKLDSFPLRLILDEAFKHFIWGIQDQIFSWGIQDQAQAKGWNQRLSYKEKIVEVPSDIFFLFWFSFISVVSKPKLKQTLHFALWFQNHSINISQPFLLCNELRLMFFRSCSEGQFALFCSGADRLSPHFSQIFGEKIDDFSVKWKSRKVLSKKGRCSSTLRPIVFFSKELRFSLFCPPINEFQKKIYAAEIKTSHIGKREDSEKKAFFFLK